MLNFLRTLFRHTLGSVVFGITSMVLTALYIAVGSGLPRVREFFEMDELQFFSAWPLVLLMILLVTNLTVVTWQRIPFTPPRYGVWCIHSGIIVLIFGLMGYYAMKVEGTQQIPLGKSVDHFYDRFERSLYVRVGSRTSQPLRLMALPRFRSYSAEQGNAGYLDRSELRELEPFTYGLTDDGQLRAQSIGRTLGLSAPLTVDVTGYWPYATIRRDFEQGSPGEPGMRTGIHLALDVPGGRPLTTWIVSGSPTHDRQSLGRTEIEHRHLPAEPDVEELRKAVGQFHRLEVKAGEFADTMFVEVGKTYTLGTTGYKLVVENFSPAFPMSGSGELVPILTLKITNEKATADRQREYRRMVISGNPLQTDFDLTAASAGPMGARQKEPIDNDLVLLYTLSDPQRLLPESGEARRLLITAAGGKRLFDVATSLSGSGAVQVFEDGTGEIELTQVHTQPRGPFQPPSAEPQQPGMALKVRVQRQDGLRHVEEVIEVPKAQRDRNTGEAGVMQVARVRLRSGDWSQEVLVPFSQNAGEVPWDGRMGDEPSPVVQVPGASAPLQLRLGNTRWLLPARITLEKFEAIPYPGGEVGPGSIMRDFKSTLLIEDRETGKSTRGVAHMNNPVYFDGGRWLFFQAAWDARNQQFTVLGIGNRPGVWTMTIGCVMILIGLLYAFYVKPILIRRMKQRALELAGRKPSPELVGV